jgi:hypothetical protein
MRREHWETIVLDHSYSLKYVAVEAFSDRNSENFFCPALFTPPQKGKYILLHIVREISESLSD